MRRVNIKIDLAVYKNIQHPWDRKQHCKYKKLMKRWKIYVGKAFAYMPLCDCKTVAPQIQNGEQLRLCQQYIKLGFRCFASDFLHHFTEQIPILWKGYCLQQSFGIKLSIHQQCQPCLDERNTNMQLHSQNKTIRNKINISKKCYKHKKQLNQCKIVKAEDIQSQSSATNLPVTPPQHEKIYNQQATFCWMLNVEIYISLTQFYNFNIESPPQLMVRATVLQGRQDSALLVADLVAAGSASLSNAWRGGAGQSAISAEVWHSSHLRLLTLYIAGAVTV